MDPIDILMNLSNLTKDKIIEIYKLSNYDINIAADILLNDIQSDNIIDNNNDYNINNLKDSFESTTLTSSISSTTLTTPITPTTPSFSSSSILATSTTSLQSLQFNKKIKNNYKILIPYYRLEEALNKIIIPKEITFQQIWTTDALVNIPGGISLCEISSDSSDDLESFLTIFSLEFNKFQMSNCFMIDSISKRENRQEFILKMKSIFYNLSGVDERDMHTVFMEEASFYY